MDYLFDAAGRFVTAKPTGWAWGPAELDPAAFFLVRSDSAALAGKLPALRRRELLAELPPSGHVAGNVFSAVTLAAAPEREHVTGDGWLVLRTGAWHPSEEDMWASVQDGDQVFFTKSPKDPDAAGALFVVDSAADQRTGGFRLCRQRELAE